MKSTGFRMSLRAILFLAVPCVACAGEPVSTQQDLNVLAVQELHRAEARMNQVHAQILKEYSDDPLFIARLGDAQKAWLNFRDRELEALFPHAKEDRLYYGSIFPMCLAQWQKRLTTERTAQLRRWLKGAEEGDACSGSMKVKPASRRNAPAKPST